jgi:uncharacterized protein YaeQ
MKATIFKVSAHLADMDRHFYSDFSLTLPRHPEETDERFMVRLVAFLLHVPADSDRGHLEFAKDLWNADEPCLWQRDLTGAMEHWIDVGLPEERRLQRMSARSANVSVLCFGETAQEWWTGLHPRLSRLKNLAIWHLPPEQSSALAPLAARSMDLHINVQDGILWISNDRHQVEVTPVRWFPSNAPNPIASS